MYAESFVRQISKIQDIEFYFQLQKWCYSNLKIACKTVFANIKEKKLLELSDGLIDYKELLLPQFWEDSSIEMRKINCFLTEIQIGMSPTSVQRINSLKNTFEDVEKLPENVPKCGSHIISTFNSINFSFHIQNFLSTKFPDF